MAVTERRVLWLAQLEAGPVRKITGAGCCCGCGCCMGCCAMAAAVVVGFRSRPAAISGWCWRTRAALAAMSWALAALGADEWRWWL